jgi:hypothetical protein
MAESMLPKFAIFCGIYQVDKNACDLCIYNQLIVDQSNIRKLLKLTNPEIVTEGLGNNFFSVFF